jgi:hypothetical protein
MMTPIRSKSLLLLIDALINLILGFVLIFFSHGLIRFFGLPETETFFYPNIFGGVLLGIGIALLVEWKSRELGMGLGLIGAIIINICGGTVLALWLLFGKLDIPAGGRVFLWCLVLVLIGLSLLEGVTDTYRKKKSEQ